MTITSSWSQTSLIDVSNFFLKSGAKLSRDNRYRFLLWRVWDKTLPPLVFLMLNPSWADAEKNDQTIRVCMARALKEGYGGIYVVNLFAYRSHSVLEMMSVTNPVGGGNDNYLKEMFQKVQDGGTLVAAYGNNGDFLKRDKHVLRIAIKKFGLSIYTLGLTKEGFPRHPLRVPYTTKPTLWENPLGE